MVELPVITVVLVSVAAAIYISKEAQQAIKSWMHNQIERYMREYKHLHDTARDEIMVDFDLWWSDKPLRVVRKRAEEDLVIPQELADTIPEEMIEVIRKREVEQKVLLCREGALHAAQHLWISTREDALLRKVSRIGGGRHVVATSVQEQRDEITKTWQHLKDMGVDTEDLKRKFTPAA